jgi:argininosuccinate lyase
MSLLPLMKSVLLGYNRAMQDNKNPLFVALDTLKSYCMVFQSMILNMKINKEKLPLCAEDGYRNATVLVDDWVKKDLSF